jgi:succinate dehydrogenase / fumarate reductase membrane anchor subunit
MKHNVDVRRWVWQRLSALGLIPLTLWFAAMLFEHRGAGRGEILAWLVSPVAVLPLAALLAVMLFHMNLGVRVVIEDYVHSARCEHAALRANNLASWLLALLGIAALARLAFGG